MKHDPQRWKADYDRDGFVVVEECLDQPTLGALREAVEQITRDPDALPPRLKQWIDFERNYVRQQPEYNEFSSEQVGNAIRNIMELPAFDPLFAKLICHAPLLDILETLFGTTEFSFHNYKCIIKAPRISSRFRWHRDLPYLEHTSPNLLTAMLCLDDMTETNGATVVMPGTHRVPHEAVGSQDKEIQEDKLPDAPRVTVCCPAGSVVLFHVNIIHGGGGNRSDIPRRNLISIWAGPDTYPTYGQRYMYQDLKPHSVDPARQKQLRMAFPGLYDERA
jgi:ectoine hydroxylase-related dioxygenase (phytanoyl-CoA dioxygenase family)